MSTRSLHWLEGLYVALAVIGLSATSAQIGPYLHAGGFVQGNLRFWWDTFATPASTFIVVDIFVFAAAALTWMFGECRRIGLSARWAWFYFLGSALIGISCFMPLFFAHRHRRLRLAHPDQQETPRGADFIGVAIMLATVAAAAVYSFTHIPG